MTLRIGESLVLNEASARFTAGQVVHLQGSNGTGKTTIFRWLSGLMHARSGTLLWGDEPLYSGSLSVPSSRRPIALCPQGKSLWPHMSVFRNIHLVAKSAEQAHITHEILDCLDLGQIQNELPHNLSGGQQQLAAIARTLASNRQIMILDEPFEALDDIARSRVSEYIQKKADLGHLFLVSHHGDLAAFGLAPTCFALSQRQIVSNT